MKSSILMVFAFCGLCLLAACGGMEGSPPSLTRETPALAITSSPPPTGGVQAAYGTGGNGFPLTASGGSTPYAWTWTPSAGSSLPPGLDISNGSIVGIPTLAGDYAVIVTVADSESPAFQTSSTYTITIAGTSPVLTITSSNLPSGKVGADYGPSSTYKCFASPVLGWHQVCSVCTVSECGSLPRCQGFFPSPCGKTVFRGFTLTATAGASPYTWSASGLPPGLSVDSLGQITGIPSATGNYKVDVTVDDSESPPVSASATFTISID